MQIEQIRRAIEVDNKKSINRAAQHLDVAQSSLSSSIKALERELGVPIFDRHQEGVTLTAFGEQFIAHAREIIKHIESIESISANTDWNQAPKRLDLMVYYLLFASKAWAKFCDKFRSEPIELNYMERNRTEIVRSVAEWHTELGLIMMPCVDREQWLALLSEQNLSYTQITVEEPYAVFGQDREFEQAKYVTPAMLAQRKMIIIPEENELFMRLDQKVFKKFRPSSFLGVCDRASLISILTGTNGYYLGTYNRKAYGRVPYYSETYVLPVKDAGYLYEIGFIQRSGHKLSEYALWYLKMIYDLVC